MMGEQGEGMTEEQRRNQTERGEGKSEGKNKAVYMPCDARGDRDYSPQKRGG